MADLDHRFVSGEPGALAEVYAEHGSLVYSYCRRRLDEETAKEVTQDVFVSAWRARDRFDADRGSLRTWLMAIAKNRLIDLYRQQARRPQTFSGVTESGVDLVDTIADHDDELERVASRMMLATAIRELPERARTVIELSFFSQLTHHEIAETTGLPIGTVKSDIRRSLLKLKQSLTTAHEVANV